MPKDILRRYFESLNKDGIVVEFKAIDWFVLKNGRIRELAICFDSQFTARMLEKSRAYMRIRRFSQKEGAG